MVTLGDLLILQNYALGATEVRLWTEAMRIQALNTSMKKILMMYDCIEYIKETTLTFTSGVANEPTDLLRPNLLNDTSAREYELVDFESFKRHVPYTYTRYYDDTNNLYKLRTWPDNVPSLTFTYIKKPTALVASGDTVLLKDHWAEGIAEKSAAILLRHTRQYDVATDKDASAKKMLDDAFQNDRPGLQGRALTRLQSIYERNSMFTNYSWYNFSNSNNTCTTMTWETITADVTATPNKGYFSSGSGTRGITLPNSTDINVGDMIGVAYKDAPWIIQQNAGQSIVFGDLTTTVGISGYIGSTLSGDTLTMSYSGDGVFIVLPGAIGNITIV